MRRTVRSYVLRQGRVTAAERALAGLMPAYGIAYRQEILDPQAVFGRRAPLVLEIGSGMGETTARIAAERPDTDFIAVEVHGPGVGSLLKLIEANGLRNLRVIRHDALDECSSTWSPTARSRPFTCSSLTPGRRSWIVTRTFAGSSVTTLATNETVLIIGQALPEGSNPEDPRAKSPTARSNVTQIFGPTAIRVSATENVVRK